MRYLHSLRILYRNLQPSKLGLVRSSGGGSDDGNNNDETVDVRLFQIIHAVELPRHHDNNLYKLSQAGTPWYMAPEVTQNGSYNLRSDMYSYGILLWELFSLRQRVLDSPGEFATSGRHAPTHPHFDGRMLCVGLETPTHV
jgi:serine/threonine protein kinase